MKPRWHRAGYPRTPTDFHGCICVTPQRLKATGGKIVILPECRYHAAAQANPRDHRIPWNCPSFYDGCNCVARKAWVRKGPNGRRYGVTWTRSR